MNFFCNATPPARLRSTALFLFALPLAAAAPERSVIRAVEVHPATINATVGQKVHIAAAFDAAGAATVTVVDRDGFPVRTLATAARVPAGRAEWTWDGRDDAGAVVADEAYSLKIDWRSGGRGATYFPADAPAAMSSIPIRYYDRRGGTLVYTLPKASRVHVQAGSAVVDRKTKTATGPVLKTIVNREPRVAGSIAEHWDGLDESGTIYVPDTPHFVIAVAATPLPENSIVVVGNGTRSFLAGAAARKGRSLFAAPAAEHAHHRGLSALEDVSPALQIEADGAQWSAKERAWLLGDAERLQLRVVPRGPGAAEFSRQPATLYHFINYRMAGRGKPASPRATISVPASSLRCGANALSVNWRSDYGSVAVNSIRVLVKKRPGGGACREVSR